MTPFEDDESDLPQPKVVSRLDNSKSTVVQTTTHNSTEEFEQAAEQAYDRMEEYKTRTLDLAIKYKSFIEDKTLSINKSPIVSDLESEIVNKLAGLASDMDSDETQSEGIGGIALCTLLLKCMLVQRNIINNLSYEVSKLQLQSKITKDD